MDAKDRIIRARIKLQETEPYYGYLVLNLKPKKEEKKVPTMGVDGKGNLYYNPSFVEDITQKEVKGVLTHEVLHCSFQHPGRRGNRNPEIWGIAVDIVVNNLLEQENGIELPEGGIIPRNDKIELGQGITIDKISEKSSEEIFDELYSKMPNKKCSKCNGTGKCQKCDGSGKQDDGNGGKEKCDNCDGSGKCPNCSGTGKELEGKKLPKGFDKHIQNEDSEEVKGQKGEGQEGEGQGGEKDWEELMNNAMVIAENQKEQGNLPAGLKRRIKEVKGTKENWKQILYRYISRNIPNDFSYQRPSKRSRAMGVFMPKTKKENLDVVVGVDTSGSISEKELKNFVAQILRINNSFQNVNITVLVLDYDIQNVVKLQGSQKQILKDLKLKGGGGTDMRKVTEWIEENKKRTQVCVVLTDGKTNYPENKSWAQIYAISKAGVSTTKLPNHIEGIKLRD